jgi:hypothetical protein
LTAVDRERSALTSSSMWIDSASVTEVISMIVSFTFLLFLLFIHIILFLSGITSGGSHTTQEIERAFTKATATRLSFDIFPVASIDEIVQIDLALVLSNSATSQFP